MLPPLLKNEELFTIIIINFKKKIHFTFYILHFFITFALYFLIKKNEKSMATLTIEYNARNNMAQRIVDIILAMDNLFKVKTAVTVPQVVVADKKQMATAFLDKWAGKFSVGKAQTDDERYNYLIEKYQ